MFKDCRGLTLTTASEQAAAALDHAVDGYLGYHADMMPRVAALLAADPEFGPVHCLKGHLFMMGFRADLLSAARSALADAQRCPGPSGRKPTLERWFGGDPMLASVRSIEPHRSDALPGYGSVLA